MLHVLILQRMPNATTSGFHNCWRNHSTMARQWSINTLKLITVFCRRWSSPDRWPLPFNDKHHIPLYILNNVNRYRITFASKLRSSPSSLVLTGPYIFISCIWTPLRWDSTAAAGRPVLLDWLLINLPSIPIGDFRFLKVENPAVGWWELPQATPAVAAPISY